jgi:hypothetical protein
MVLQTENLDNKFRFKSSFITFAIVVFIHERCLSLSALSPQLQLYWVVFFSSLICRALVCGIEKLNLNMGSIQREVISDLKGETQLLSKDILESIWLISKKTSVNRFKTGFYSTWRNWVPLRIWTQLSTFKPRIFLSLHCNWTPFF